MNTGQFEVCSFVDLIMLNSMERGSVMFQIGNEHVFCSEPHAAGALR